MGAKKAMKAMKKGMKAMKSVKSISKGGIADALATATEGKKSEMGKLLDALAELATSETKKTGKFVIPGVCMIKTRHSSKEGWQAYGFWQRSEGEGKGSTHSREVLCSESSEGVRVRDTCTLRAVCHLVACVENHAGVPTPLVQCHVCH